jgi:hypothetical protein
MNVIHTTMTNVQDYQSSPTQGGSRALVDVEMGAAKNITHPISRIPTYLQPSMPLLERLHHFTFAWYTLT